MTPSAAGSPRPESMCDWQRARDRILHAILIEIRAASRDALCGDGPAPMPAWERVYRMADLAHTLPTMTDVTRDDLAFLVGQDAILGRAAATIAKVLDCRG